MSLTKALASLAVSSMISSAWGVRLDAGNMLGPNDLPGHNLLVISRDDINQVGVKGAYLKAHQRTRAQTSDDDDQELADISRGGLVEIKRGGKGRNRSGCDSRNC